MFCNSTDGDRHLVCNPHDFGILTTCGFDLKIWLPLNDYLCFPRSHTWYNHNVCSRIHYRLTFDSFQQDVTPQVRVVSWVHSWLLGTPTSTWFAFDWWSCVSRFLSVALFQPICNCGFLSPCGPCCGYIIICDGYIIVCAGYIFCCDGCIIICGGYVLCCDGYCNGVSAL